MEIQIRIVNALLSTRLHKRRLQTINYYISVSGERLLRWVSFFSFTDENGLINSVARMILAEV